jgi:hypothetical protein
MLEAGKQHFYVPYYWLPAAIASGNVLAHPWEPVCQCLAKILPQYPTKAVNCDTIHTAMKFRRLPKATRHKMKILNSGESPEPTLYKP